MKIITLIAIAFFLVACENNEAELGLPPQTTTGANTFGCYINGETYAIWKPRFRERNVSAGFSSRGPIIISSNYREWRGNGFAQTAMFIEPPLVEDSTYIFIPSNSSGNTAYYTSSMIEFAGSDLISGSLTLTRWDSEARIISGIFEFTLANGADTVRITEGRFDIDEVVF